MDEGKGGPQRIVGRDEMENLDYRPADATLVTCAFAALVVPAQELNTNTATARRVLRCGSAT